MNTQSKSVVDLRRENFGYIVKVNGGQANVARRLNKDRNQVWQWLRDPEQDGHRNMSSAIARQIETEFGMPPNWLDQEHETLMATLGPYPSGSRPIGEWDGHSELPPTHQGIDRIEVFLSAGDGRGVSQAEPQQLTPNVFRADFLRAAGWSRRTHFSMYVRGDSMEPRIPDGSTVVVDVTDRDPKSGKSSVYAIVVDGEPRLKRLLRLPGGAIRVSSDNPNPAYAPFDVGPETRHELEIIGRVVHLSTTFD